MSDLFDVQKRIGEDISFDDLVDFSVGDEITSSVIRDASSQLIRTAFIPREGYKFIVADFSAIEARVIAHIAGEKWRAEVFKNGGDIYCASASQMFHCKVEKHGENAHLRQKGKIAELALGYGGSVGALKSMGALDMGMSEDELKPLVDSWRAANSHIVQLWYAVDRCVKETVMKHIPTETHGLKFTYQSGMLFITLPSCRRLAYVKPKMGINRFGSESVTYQGNCIVMDNDNTHSDDPNDWIKPEAYKTMFPDVAFIVVPSRNNMKPKDGKSPRPRHHIYFPIDTFTDKDAYKQLKEMLMAKYPFFDDNALDAARFIYGNPTTEIPVCVRC